MKPVVLHQRHSISTIEDAFTRDECAELIAFAEGIGFTAAPITTASGFVMMPDVRNNTRVMVDDRDRAAALWRRLSPVVPANRGPWAAVGLNERFRFYRYD